MATLEELGRKLQELVAASKKGDKPASFSEDGVEYYLVTGQDVDTEGSRPFSVNTGLLRPPKDRAAYSDRTAWLMAELSKLAYDEFEDDPKQKAALLAHLREGGFTKTRFIDNPETDTQAFLTVKPGAFAVLAFRGTEQNFDDIITDMKAKFYKSESGSSHEGFSTAYKSVASAVDDAIEKEGIVKKPLPLFITGHSLGGALATVATCELEKRLTVSGCYTFGSPRVGDAEWSDNLKTPVYRVVNGADVVPMVPASDVLKAVLLWISDAPFLNVVAGWIKKFVASGFVGYQHAGDMRFVRGDQTGGTLKIGSAAAFSRVYHVAVGKILDAIRKLRPKAARELFTDHSIKHYAVILKRIAERRNNL